MWLPWMLRDRTDGDSRCSGEPGYAQHRDRQSRDQGDPPSRCACRDRSQSEQHTVATFNMYVELPHNFKGTHMSRFVAILNNHEYEITVKSFRDMLTEMTMLLEADAGHIEMTFPYFVRKASPVTGSEEPHGLRGDAGGPDHVRIATNRGTRGGAGDQLVSLLQADLGVRSPQSALARHGAGRRPAPGSGSRS